MKSLIITVAGLSSRFNKDLDSPCLKSIYFKNKYRDTLLFQIIEKAKDIEEIIIVGGYSFPELESYVQAYLGSLKNKIKLVDNKEFSTKGSGWSLYLGIQSVSLESKEIIFVEGDLYYDKEDFFKVTESNKSVFTINREPIYASKAVVVYKDLNDRIKYLYDTNHKYIEIAEPVKAVFNSAQIWKFNEVFKLRDVLGEMTEKTLSKTNLEIIQRYFDKVNSEDTECVQFTTWLNCNTIHDYDKMLEQINGKS